MGIKVTTHENLMQDMKRRDVVITALRTTAAIDYIDGDGHSIYDAETLISKGFPEFLVRENEYVHKSDLSSAKTTIFGPDGNIVPELKGVAALALHYAVANALLLEAGVDYNDTLIGRGFMARELADAIKKDLASYAG